MSSAISDPNLIEPVTATIVQIDKAATSFDNVHREPINIVQRETGFDVQCQVEWNYTLTGVDKATMPEPTPEGINDQQPGYIIVLTKDLDALGKTLARGDKITKLADRTVELFIERVTYHSHYSGKFRLCKALFLDRLGQDG